MPSEGGTRHTRVADAVVPLALAAQAGWLLALVAPMLTRPLWYNEQWRGWFLAQDSAPWHADPLTLAPMSFGYAALTRLSTALFGQHEAALRAPSAVALVLLAVLAYRLARRWLGVVASAVTVAALLLNRMLLTFGAELAPYTIEAACVVALLLCWLRANDEGTTPLGRALCYAAMAALALVATPAILVLAPLLAVDLGRAVRTRAYAALVPSALAGLTALAHLTQYVAAQSSQRRGPYWAAHFLPRDPGEALGAVWRGLASWVPNALTGGTAHLPSIPDGEVAFPGAARGTLAVFLVAAVVGGLVAALREAELRPLAVALLGCLALQVVASLARAWPFGFTRVNTFLLPLAYVVAAVGVSRAFAAARAPARGVVVLAGVAAYALVLAVGARQVATVRAEAHGPAFGTGLAWFVGAVRERAGPRDVVVLVHQMTEKGWKYYMHVRDGGEGRRLRERQTTLVSQSEPDAKALARFLDRHRRAVRVYVVAVRGTPREPVRLVLDAMRARGYVETATWREPDTGSLLEFTATARL